MLISTPPVALTQQQPVCLEDCTKAQLNAYFQSSWQLYEWLFSALKSEAAFYQQPDPLRHPLIFYWGHTAAFYINKLCLAGLLEKGINPRYEILFAKGVDPEAADDLEAFQWPDLASVSAYRQAVKETIEQVIDQVEGSIHITAQHPLWALLMGIEHDRIHFETSSVLIRQLGLDYLQRPEGWEYAPSAAPSLDNPMIAVEGGSVTFGKSTASKLYGWDNEYGARTATVAPFEASQQLISNADYLEFYNSGAYQKEQYWSVEGWKWKNEQAVEHPKFWVPQGTTFAYRAMFDMLPMPLDYPVEVNAHEAWAYCKWRGDQYRLLSEAEFQFLVQHTLPEHDESQVLAAPYNINMRYGSPTSVQAQAATNLRFYDLWGNVWDWLQDDFYPLDGFEIHPWYDDFSAPYFDDQHSMMLGGAWATTGTGASCHYRLWFRRHFYQHAGFRLARSL